MKYFGIDIHDGKPLKEMLLDERIPLKEQWFHLTQDITCIDYLLHDKLEFSIDVGWYPYSFVDENSHFRVVLIEGAYTDGGVFYFKEIKTIKSMKQSIEDAVNLVQSFKSKTIEEILKLQVK